METRPPGILETRRLVLTRARRDDAPAIFEYASDPEVTRLMDWRTHTVLSEAADFIERSEKRWTLGTEFTWLITMRPDGLPVGAISSSPEGHRATIGYVLNRRYWSKKRVTLARLLRGNAGRKAAEVTRMRARNFTRLLRSRPLPQLG